MFSVFKRPFGAPNAVIYSYELSSYFLDKRVNSILEVGCGIGVFALRYASSRRDAEITAVDHSAATIEFLAANYGKHYKNVQLEVCDFCAMELDLGRTFDAVYSSDVLEHVAETRTFVKNIYRHLRPGGTAVLNFPNQTNHGINHFNEVEDLRELFADFSQVRVFTVRISHSVGRLWFSVREFYEKLFSRSTQKDREQLYAGREEQGIDFFEDSTCFKFNQDRRKAMIASLLGEAFLLIKPRMEIDEVEGGNILNSPRIVVVASK